jgi:hypothetical protein
MTFHNGIIGVNDCLCTCAFAFKDLEFLLNTLLFPKKSLSAVLFIGFMGVIGFLSQSRLIGQKQSAV